MSNPITKVDDKSYEKTRMKKDDKKTRLRKHKGIKVGEGGGVGVSDKGAKGANPSNYSGKFFHSTPVCHPPVDSHCLPSRFTILRHKEVGRKTKQQQQQQQEKRMKNIVLACSYTFTLNFVYCNTWTSTLTLWSAKLKKKKGNTSSFC